MKTQLKLHTHFDECEAEDLISHHRVQYGCELIVLDTQNAVVGKTESLSDETLAEVMKGASEITVWPSHPTELPLPGYIILVHEHRGHRFIELTPDRGLNPIPQNVSIPNEGKNIFHTAQRVCEAVAAALPYERVMVYRFNDDYSGEVIAEVVEETLEPFLGLHYPATDIPRQAREIYYECSARVIYSAAPEFNQLALPANVTVDQTRVSCRGVSPFHLQYLANMGSAATASAAIIVNQRLWGLLSLHRNVAPAPDLRLQPMLHNLSDALSTLFQDATHEEELRRVQRAQALEKRLEHQLQEDFDLVPGLLMSNQAIHRLTGGIGVGLIAGNVEVHVGQTPDSNVTQRLVEHHIDAGDQTFFCSEIGNQISHPSIRGIGGYAFIRIGTSPRAALVIYRREVAQTVAWGGDPRRETLDTGGGKVQYTPRSSFESWVESVEGRCLPWDGATKATLERLIDVLAHRFGGGDASNLGLLLSYSATQLVKSQDKVKARLRSEFGRLQQSIAIAISEGDDDPGSILGINESAAQAFNIAEQEAEEMSMQHFAEITSLPLDKLGTDETHLVSVWTHDLGNRELEVKVERHLDFKNTSLGLATSIKVYYLSDVTEAKRVELAMQAAFKRTQRSAELQAQVVAQLMHEMRTPLNSIVGFSTFVSDPSIPDTDRMDFVSRIVRNAELLNRIIKNSEVHVKNMRQQLREESKLIDLSDSISSVLRTLELQMGEQGIRLRHIPSEEEVRVFIAPSVVDQVLINLVGNAAKFSHPEQEVTVSCQRHGEHAILEVIDEGIGMTPEQAAEATAPFKRFTQKPGSGLGLSIVKQLVEANDGELEIQSELGKGTTVRVKLPM